MSQFKILWIIDSGILDHETNAYYLFAPYSPCTNNPKVTVTDGFLSFVAAKGSIQISNSIVRKFILHVPNLSCNLMSINQLTKDSYYSAKFILSHCIFQDLLSRKTIGSVKECEEPYSFDDTNVSEHFQINL